jgi:hypothetical protein
MGLLLYIRFLLNSGLIFSTYHHVFFLFNQLITRITLFYILHVSHVSRVYFINNRWHRLHCFIFSTYYAYHMYIFFFTTNLHEFSRIFHLSTTNRNVKHKRSYVPFCEFRAFCVRQKIHEIRGERKAFKFVSKIFPLPIQG